MINGSQIKNVTPFLSFCFKNSVSLFVNGKTFSSYDKVKIR